MGIGGCRRGKQIGRAAGIPMFGTGAGIDDICGICGNQIGRAIGSLILMLAVAVVLVLVLILCGNQIGRAASVHVFGTDVGIDVSAGARVRNK